MMKKNRAKINYGVDLIIGIGFLLSAVSGIVLLFAGSGGYQGGRNTHFTTEMLLLSRTAWKDLHTWSSLVMIVGVALHLVLHWNWIVLMTRNLFKRKAAVSTNTEVCQIEAS
jgi:hypothetical protein